MFPSSKFRRNQQPSLKGRTQRVRNDGTTSYSELHYAREQVYEACKRAGNVFAHWRRFTPEFNAGTCPVCYNPRTKQPIDPNCPNCFGTGYDGGFSRPSIQHMIVNHSDRRLEATEKGFVRLLRAKSQSPYLPNISPGDILGEVQNMEGEFIVADRYLVEAGVEKQRFRQRDEFLNPDTYDHLDPESEVFGYEFESTRIPKHSDEQKRRMEYWIPFDNPIWLTSLDGSG